jgi:hypothetical protein
MKKTFLGSLFASLLITGSMASATTSIGVGLNGAISNCTLMGGRVNNPYYDCTANPNGTYVCQCDTSSGAGPNQCSGTTSSSIGVGLNEAVSNCAIAGGRVNNPYYDCTANPNGTYVCVCCK